MSIKIDTLKDFLKLIGKGIDVCDEQIETPYCYMELLDKVDSSYDKFLDYVERNVELKYYNPNYMSCGIVGVDYLGFIRKNYQVWYKFTQKFHIKEGRRCSFESKNDFIENYLCYALEKMLIGSYPEEGYEEFLKIVDEVTMKKASATK